MKILAIETSCDETSAAVIEDGRKVLSNIVSSQIDFHRKYGGIVPEIASRKHAEVINAVIAEALEKAKIAFSDISAVAVTYGPGLPGALLVGLCAAKAIAYANNIPLIPVNHIEAHIYANFLAAEPRFPFISLVVSGGHTELILAEEQGKYRSLGRTRDDAAGEAFDKVARFLNLGYPGGPIIDRMAKGANAKAIDFPRGLTDGSYDFSFSGVKTAVVYYVKANPDYQDKISRNDLVASFQKAVVDVLVDKTIKAAADLKCNSIALAGGVSANSMLREEFQRKGRELKLGVLIPDMTLCTDNAAMVGCAGYHQFMRGGVGDKGLKAVSNLRI